MQCSTRLSHVPTPPNYRLSALVSRAEFPEKRSSAKSSHHYSKPQVWRDTGVAMIEGQAVNCPDEFLWRRLAAR
jgi:hypothetical protein